MKTKENNRMISTRARKFKFTQGEKVLCYEPDKSKAQVLYDSKVVEVISKKDKGKKTWEYLIHFQGWNSSWDRYVPEDDILKDTEENRRLQKDLAQKARLHHGGYLYHRERKRLQLGLASKTRESSEPRRSYRKQEQESPSEEEIDDIQEERDVNDDEEDAARSSSSHHNEDIMSADEASGGEEEEDDEDMPVTAYDIGSILMDYLYHDFAAINEQHKLVKIPAEHNIVSILEAYMKHCAVQQLTVAPEKPDRRSKNATFNSDTNDMDKVCRRLSIIKEIVHSLRISFDYLLSKQLLYKNERPQFESFQNFIPRIKKERTDSFVEHQNTTEFCENITETSPLSTSPGSSRRSLHSFNEAVTVGRTLRSCRSPVEPRQSASADGKVEHSTTTPVHVAVKEEISTSGAKSPPKTYSLTSPSANLDSNGQYLLNKILSWHMIPEKVLKEKPNMPSLHYGAIHLTRLLYNLPAHLVETNITNKNMCVIFKHLDEFCRYLERQKEWFKDIYIDSGTNEEVSAP